MDTTRLIRHATRWLGTFLLLGACALLRRMRKTTNTSAPMPSST